MTTRTTSPSTVATLSAQQITLRAGERTLLERFTHTFYPAEISVVLPAPFGPAMHQTSPG
jgi:hypothetical protein